MHFLNHERLDLFNANYLKYFLVYRDIITKRICVFVTWKTVCTFSISKWKCIVYIRICSEEKYTIIIVIILCLPFQFKSRNPYLNVMPCYTLHKSSRYAMLFNTMTSYWVVVYIFLISKATRNIFFSLKAVHGD